MKFKLIAETLIQLIVLACGFTALGEETAPVENITSTVSFNDDPVLTARLLNMLEHNRVYNSDFEDKNLIIENSVVALFEKADADGYVSKDLVNGFVYSMYGFTAEGYSEPKDFVKKEGFFFILPRGYDEYDHEITSIKKNGDYIYATSLLTVDAHDGLAYNLTCNTVFKVNPTSGFGYNIVSSNYY